MTVSTLRISPLVFSLIAVMAALLGSTALAQALNPFDEMAKATNWPNGANYRNEGRFRAWSSIPDDPKIDLSKLKGIDDIVQVHVHRDGWVVLRKNGQTISSDGKADRENIKRIFRGVFNWFGFISNEGGIIGFGSNGQLNENEIPSDLGPVKDAYMGVHNRVALLENGSIRVWGKAFDGIKLEKGNLEWPEKPSLPPGKKAVAISCSDWLIAIKTDDGALHLFSYFHGKIQMPPEFGTGKIGAFCANRSWLFGTSKESGNGIVMFVNKDGSTKIIGFQRGENAAEFLNTESGAALLNTGGRLTVNNGNFNAVPGLKDSLPWVKNPQPDLISVSVAYRKPPLIGRILWFEGKTGPSASAPETVTSVKNPVKPPMPSQVVKMPAKEVIPKTPAAQIPAIPELRSRIVTYQTARRDQLSKLALKYGKALNAADQAARKSGNLDQVEAVRAALQQASKFKVLFTGLPKSLDVAPLPGLPPLAANTPDSVKRLRPIFDAEKLRIETANYVLLEASLKTLQVEQVKVRKMKEARELETYRANLDKIFAKVKTSQPVVVVAAVTKPVPTPVKPVKAVVPKRKTPAIKGRLKTWSARDKDEAIRLTRGRGFDDFVQVYLSKGAWIALRENGDVVSSNRKIDRRGIARITKGWDGAFGMIDQKGALLVFASQAAKPKKPLQNVKDAFISEVHSIALHHDGSITTWGPAYEGKTGDGQKWVPAPTGLANIRKVLGNPELGAVHTNDGNVIAWRSTGPCRMGNVINKNVQDISAPFWGFRLINSDGDLRWWRAKDSGTNLSKNWKERYGPLKTLLHTQEGSLIISSAGTVITDLGWIEQHSDLRKILQDLKGEPDESFAFYSDKGILRLAWIEAK